MHPLPPHLSPELAHLFSDDTLLAQKQPQERWQLLELLLSTLKRDTDDGTKIQTLVLVQEAGQQLLAENADDRRFSNLLGDLYDMICLVTEDERIVETENYVRLSFLVQSQVMVTATVLLIHFLLLRRESDNDDGALSLVETVLQDSFSKQLVERHVRTALAHVSQVNTSSNRLLRQACCESLLELQTFIPGLLSDQMTEILKYCQRECTHCAQSYTLLLTKVLEHWSTFQVLSPENSAVATTAQTQSASQAFTLPVAIVRRLLTHYSNPCAVVNAAVAPANAPTAASQQKWLKELHSCLSFIIENATLFTLWARLDIVRQISSMLTVQDQIGIPRQSQLLLFPLHVIQSSPFYKSLSNGLSPISLHLALQLKYDLFREDVVTGGSDDRLLVERLLWSCNDLSLPPYQRLLALSWLRERFNAVSSLAELRYPENGETLIQIYPNPFDELCVKHAKLSLFTRLYASHLRATSASVLSQVTATFYRLSGKSPSRSIEGDLIGMLQCFDNIVMYYFGREVAIAPDAEPGQLRFGNLRLLATLGFISQLLRASYAASRDEAAAKKLEQLCIDHIVRRYFPLRQTRSHQRMLEYIAQFISLLHQAEEPKLQRFASQLLLSFGRLLTGEGKEDLHLPLRRLLPHYYPLVFLVLSSSGRPKIAAKVLLRVEDFVRHTISYGNPWTIMQQSNLLLRVVKLAMTHQHAQAMHKPCSALLQLLLEPRVDSSCPSNIPLSEVLMMELDMKNRAELYLRLLNFIVATGEGVSAEKIRHVLAEESSSQLQRADVASSNTSKLASVAILKPTEQDDVFCELPQFLVLQRVPLGGFDVQESDATADVSRYLEAVMSGKHSIRLNYCISYANDNAGKIVVEDRGQVDDAPISTPTTSLKRNFSSSVSLADKGLASSSSMSSLPEIAPESKQQVNRSFVLAVPSKVFAIAIQFESPAYYEELVPVHVPFVSYRGEPREHNFSLHLFPKQPMPGMLQTNCQFNITAGPEDKDYRGDLLYASQLGQLSVEFDDLLLPITAISSMSSKKILFDYMWNGSDTSAKWAEGVKVLPPQFVGQLSASHSSTYVGLLEHFMSSGLKLQLQDFVANRMDGSPEGEPSATAIDGSKEGLACLDLVFFLPQKYHLLVRLLLIKEKEHQQTDKYHLSIVAKYKTSFWPVLACVDAWLQRGMERLAG